MLQAGLFHVPDPLYYSTDVFQTMRIICLEPYPYRHGTFCPLLSFSPHTENEIGYFILIQFK